MKSGDSVDKNKVSFHVTQMKLTVAIKQDHSTITRLSLHIVQQNYKNICKIMHTTKKVTYAFIKPVL